ncbi:restriction endonuclease subunit S [Neisseria sp.]
MNRYERYKDSGVPWLGEIPEHWNICHLKDEVTFNDEVLGDKTDADYEILYVDISSVSLIEGIVQKEPMSFENSPSRARRIVKNGDVIVSTVRTYLKAITQIQDAEDNLIVSTGFAVLRPKENLFPRFLGYWVQSENMIGAIVSNSVGVSYPAINATDLVRLPIVKLPLKEQTAIAHYLDTKLGEIDALIDKQQTLLEKLAEQRTAVITHAVTKGLNPAAPMKKSGVEWLGDVPAHWEVLSIKRLSQVKRGASPRPIDNPDYFDDDGEYAWVRIADVTASNMYLLETTQRLSDLGKSFSVPLQPNSLFLSIAGSVGKPIITKIKACIHDGFVYFPEYKNNIKFLYYIFCSGQPYLGLGKMGTQLNLNTDTVGAIKIALPTKEEQDNITDYLDQETAKIDRLCETVNQTIGRLKEYRTALITQAVTGKIKVTDE